MREDRMEMGRELNVVVKSKLKHSREGEGFLKTKICASS